MTGMGGGIGMRMAGLVMAGGRGARMSGSGGPREKLLIERGGTPAVLGVVDAMLGSGAVHSVHAATSPHAPAAAAALRRAGVGIVPTAGAGYSADLAEAVSALARAGYAGPALVVPGDMPLLTAAALRSLATMYGSAIEGASRRGGAPAAAAGPPVWACFVVPAGQRAGSRADPRCATPEGNADYTGISIVDLAGAAAAARARGGPAGAGAACDTEMRIPLEDPLIAVSYNTASDIGLVERIAGLRPGPQQRQRQRPPPPPRRPPE